MCMFVLFTQGGPRKAREDVVVAAPQGDREERLAYYFVILYYVILYYIILYYIKLLLYCYVLLPLPLYIII